MSDLIDEETKEEGRARARSTAVWDSRICDKAYWDYLMTIIPHDAIGADMTKQAPYNSYGRLDATNPTSNHSQFAYADNQRRKPERSNCRRSNVHVDPERHRVPRGLDGAMEWVAAFDQLSQ